MSSLYFVDVQRGGEGLMLPQEAPSHHMAPRGSGNSVSKRQVSDETVALLGTDKDVTIAEYFTV